MRKAEFYVIPCCLLAGPALAQALPPDVQELERAHQADEEQRDPIPEKPRPYFVPDQRLHAPRQVWRCLGTSAWQKVYAKPDASSPVIGLTQPQVASPTLIALWRLSAPSMVPRSPNSLPHQWSRWLGTARLSVCRSGTTLRATTKPRWIGTAVMAAGRADGRISR